MWIEITAKTDQYLYQIFLSSIALTPISNKNIVERLFVFQGKFVNTHVGDPAGTGSADRVPTVDHTGIIVLGVATNLPHIEAADGFNIILRVFGVS